MEFSWAGVAAAGLMAGVGQALGGEKLAAHFGQGGDTSPGNIAAHTGIGMARAIAGAATRSLIDGSDFGDNVMASLPDVIGQTIGEAIAGGLGRSAEPDSPEKLSINAVASEYSQFTEFGDSAGAARPISLR